MCHQKHHKWYEECPCPGCSIIRAFNPQRMGVFTSTQKSQCSLRKHKHKWGFPGGTSSKESACHTEDIRDMSLIPGSGRSPGWRHGNPLQYSCLENPWTEEPGGLQCMGHRQSGPTEATWHKHKCLQASLQCLLSLDLELKSSLCSPFYCPCYLHFWLPALSTSSNFAINSLVPTLAIIRSHCLSFWLWLFLTFLKCQTPSALCWLFLPPDSEGSACPEQAGLILRNSNRINVLGGSSCSVWRVLCFKLPHSYHAMGSRSVRGFKDTEKHASAQRKEYVKGQWGVCSRERSMGRAYLTSGRFRQCITAREVYPLKVKKASNQNHWE